MKPAADKKNRIPVLPMALFLIAPFFAGLFFEAFAAAAALVLLGWLGVHLKKQRKLVLRGSLSLWAVILLDLSYLLVLPWAVDSGAALLGFVKFLPLPLFAAACQQTDGEQKERALRLVPYAGALMTLLSLPLGLIPAFEPFFRVNGRLAGFFQYPNTFALYLLLGIALLSQAEAWRLQEMICTAVLFAGIALSGSRTTLILLGLLAVYTAFRRVSDKKARILLPVFFAAVVGLSLLYTRLSGDDGGVGRITAITAASSTLNGRLLYFTDALPVILKHPFGLGYLGYYYLQGSFQTGVYSVMHIHNELLQFLLDVGWIPAGILTWAIVRNMIRGGEKRRVLLLLFTAHCMMDFDLQFIAMGLFLVLLTEEEGKRRYPVGRTAGFVIGVPLAALCLYIGTAAALHQAGNETAAAALYPPYTQAQTALLTKEDTAEGMDARAERILKGNSSVSLAWSARARAAYSRGEIGQMMEYKRKAIELARYSREEYLDYADMLWTGLQLYEKAGDAASAEICRSELREIPQRMEAVLAGTSRFGRRIYDQPELELSPEYAWLKDFD